jgi:hypothetical protein
MKRVHSVSRGSIGYGHRPGTHSVTATTGSQQVFIAAGTILGVDPTLNPTWSALR